MTGSAVSAADKADRAPSLVKNLKLDLRSLLRRPDQLWRSRWTNLGLGLVAIGASATADAAVRSHLQDSAGTSQDQRAQDLRPLGQAGGIVLAGLGWGIGHWTHRRELESTSVDCLEATIISAGLLAPAIKYTVGRARPNAELGPHHFRPFSTNASFPSGEATAVFAMASAISEHYSSAWARIAAWGTAAVVAEGRLQLDEHWLSDVVAGGLLGSAVGTWVVREHRRRETAETLSAGADSRLRWIVEPQLLTHTRSGRPVWGVGAALSW